MIFNTSRYVDGPLADVTDNQTGTTRKVVYRKWPAASTNFAIYVWKDSDRIDIVALQLFGSPDAWWQLMDWNPEVLDPSDIPPGTKLRVPL